MNRRDFLKTAGAVSIFTALGPDIFAGEEKVNPSGKPNILVIMSDEHNAGVTGCYNNDIIRTPNIDSIAKEGITFDNCYCNSPLCVPSRLSFISGKYISRTGAWSNECWLPGDDYPSIAGILNKAGYESYLCGKMHFDKSRRYGFTEIGAPLNENFMNGICKRIKPDSIKPGKAVSGRFNEFHAGDESPVLNHDRKVTQGAVDFLKKRTASDKPFFMITGYLAPHFPLIVPQRYWDAYKGKVPMPYIPEGHLESQCRNYKCLRFAFQMENVPDDIVRKGRELYYGLTQWMDEEIGKVLEVLKKSPVADNTIVIYTSDHGENMGEHGLWWKNCMYEHASRVPLIISWPSRWEGGQRRLKACSLLDLTQTIAGISGAQAPRDWNGDSMLKWMGNGQSEWKDMAVSEYYAHFVTSGFAMIRKDNYKYVYHTSIDENHPAEKELYDLKKDPGEFNNLSNDKEQAERIKHMHEAMVNEIGEEPDESEKRCLRDFKTGYGRSLLDALAPLKNKQKSNEGGE